MYRIVSVIILLSVILAVRLFIYAQKEPEYIPGKEVTISGIVWDDPQRLGRIQRVKLEEITLIMPEFPMYQYGDSLAIQGIVEENTFISKSGDTVTELVIEQPQVQISESPAIIRAAVWMRMRIITIFTSLLPVHEAALLLGITLGVRSEFSRGMLDIFTQTGILHIVAASGSNVAIVAGVLLFSLQHFVMRKLAILITVAAVAWYAVLAGFDPAIVRASIMALIALSAQLLGRQQISYFMLVLTVWIMLMLSPQMMGNVGFLLSVSATAGIITLKPLLDTVFRKFIILKDDLTTTLAAQWGSLPIILGFFGNFAPLSIAVNLCVLWVVPIIMILGLLGSLGALVHPNFAAPFVYGAYPFTVFFLTVIDVVKSMVGTISIEQYSVYLTISYYSLSLSIILFLKLKWYDKK